MKNYDSIKKIVAEMEADVQKFDGGTNAAGKRVRAYCQDIKKQCQELRTAVQDMKAKRAK